MKTILLIFIIALLLVGCADKNPAYNEFKKSPCACFEQIKSELNNV
jgi:PBP1b-binding outer membrane lipoprotein LpoB